MFACSASAIALAWGVGGSAAAQDIQPPSTTVDEIVVTAQKRTQNIQDVPISIIAIGGDALEAAKIERVADLKVLAPGLEVTRGTQIANQRIQIRGVGSAGNSGIEPSVGLFLDGVYVARPAALLGNLVDIEGVEVLRGPQGTLFGRNTTMGVISVNTRSPSFERALEGAASYGSWDTAGFRAIGNLPLSDTVAGRLVVAGSRTDGPAYNDLAQESIGQRSDILVRASLRWDINDQLRWIGRLDHQHIAGDGAPHSELIPSTLTPTSIANFRARLDRDGAGPEVAELPDVSDAFDEHLYHFQKGDLKDTQVGVTSDLTWDFDNRWRARYIAGYRDWTNEQAEGDVLLTPYDLATRNARFTSESISHELQLISPERELMGGRLDLVLGLYSFEEDYTTYDRTDLGFDYCDRFIRNALPARLAGCLAGPLLDAGHNGLVQEASSLAVFGESVVHLTDTLDLTLGARYTSEEKTGSIYQVRNNTADLLRGPENTELSYEDDQLTYRLISTWTPASDLLFYASYATGYKAGGFENAPSTTPLGQERIFDPETNENWELGTRTSWLDGALTLNGTLYRTDIEDFQVRSWDGLRFLTRNAASLRQQGVETEARWRVDHRLATSARLAYLDSEYLSYPDAPNLPGFGGTQDLAGERAPWTPKWQGSWTVEFEDVLTNGWGWSVRSDLYFVGDQNVGGDGNNPDAIQRAYALLNLRFALSDPSARWQVSVYGQNLFDKDYCSSIFVQAYDGPFGLRNAATGSTALRCTVGTPRFVGAELSAKF